MFPPRDQILDTPEYNNNKHLLTVIFFVIELWMPLGEILIYSIPFNLKNISKEAKYTYH